MKITYESVTDAAARTIEMLTIQSIGQLTEDDQAWWDMGRGVIRMWEEAVGHAAMPADRERLEALLAAMPGADDPGDGNWHLTPVTKL